MGLSFYIIVINNDSPQNIGSISRLMGNYNFDDLVLINPKWLNEKDGLILSHTKEGIKIFKNRKYFDSLKKAIVDLKLNLTIGFTRRAGKYREISDNYRDYFDNFFKRNNFELKIGLVFGNEETGIIDEDIKLCNILLYIPTSSISPSLNLSQSVAIILNELFYYISNKKNKILSNLALDAEEQFKPSKIEDREKFYEEIIRHSEFKKLFIKNNLDTLRRMFERVFASPVISEKDLKLLKRFILRTIYSDIRNNKKNN